jgi:hypothetical protein
LKKISVRSFITCTLSKIIIKLRSIIWTGHVASMLRTGVYVGFWWKKPEEKRPLGSYWCRLEDNIKTHLREIGWGGMDLIHLPEDRNQWRALVNTVMNLRIP